MANDITNIGAASVAPAPAVVTSRMTVENRHSGLEVSSFRPGADLQAVAAAQRLFERVRCSEAGRPFVDGVDAEDIFERKAMMATARQGRRYLGVLHYHLTPSGMTIRGLAADPHRPGNKLGSALAALAMTHGGIMFGEVPVACAIREMPNGGLNEPSRQSFARLGFDLQAESHVGYLTGTYRDRHQWESAEEDDVGAVYIRYRMMSAGPASYARARAFLAAWSQAILPIRPKRRGR